MKKHGSTLEFTAERTSELLGAFRREALTSGNICLAHICQSIVKKPASRFWVSEERAAQVISQESRGLSPISRMRGPKQRMFVEIKRRVEALRAASPEAPLIELVEQVVYNPAPEHYMAAGTALDIIYKTQRAQRKARRNGDDC